MAEIQNLSYRSFDELLDTIRIDFSSYQSEGDIDASSLIKVAQRVNYELGLRLYQQKETMIEINHGRGALPADFHQMVIALACYNYTHVQESPSNGHVLLEQVLPKPGITTCPCWEVINTGSSPVSTTMVNCETITVPVTFPPGTTNVCAISIVNPNESGNTQQQSSQGSGPSIATCATVQNNESTAQLIEVTYFDGTVAQFTVPPNSITCYCVQYAGPADPNSSADLIFTAIGDCYSNTDNWCCSASSNNTLQISTSSFCYNTNTNGVYSCGCPNTCNICNVEHPGGVCPEVVINPYPLGQCRTICQGTDQQATIKILQYCSNQVFCYETFERLWIVPNIQSGGFSNRKVNGTANPNTASINGRFLETNSYECTKVYLQYMGNMTTEDGQLLVLDHPTINFYYEWALKHYLLEHLWLNGEPDIDRRMQYAEKQMLDYRAKSLDIVNAPNYRDVINTIQVLRANSNRQYYNTISRYFGYLGWNGYSSAIDPYNIR